MEDRQSRCFIVLIVILFVVCKISFAQDIPLTYRDDLILTTLDYLHTKQEENNREMAIKEAMKGLEGQMNEVEIEKRESASFFSNIALHTHPYLTEEAAYDNNIDYPATPKKSSIINKVTPGLKMNFRDRGKYLALDIHMGHKFYNNRSDADSQNAQIQALNTFNIGRYIFTFFDDYFNNYSSAKRFVADDADTQYNWKNTFSSTLGRSFNRFGFDAGYKRATYDYQGGFNNNDRTENIFSFNPYLRITKKTRFLLEYSRTITSYEPNSTIGDFNSDDYNLSLSNVVTSKITSLAKIGYKVADYKISDDTRDTTLTGDVGYKISERSDIDFIYKYLIHEESTKSDYFLENNLKLSGNHRLAFNPKFKLSFSTEADYMDYPKKVNPPNPQKNTTYTFKLSLSYAFRQWLDFSLEWVQKKLRSNVDADYDKDVVTFKTQAKF